MGDIPAGESAVPAGMGEESCSVRGVSLTEETRSSAVLAERDCAESRLESWREWIPAVREPSEGVGLKAERRRESKSGSAREAGSATPPSDETPLCDANKQKKETVGGLRRGKKRGKRGGEGLGGGGEEGRGGGEGGGEEVGDVGLELLDGTLEARSVERDAGDEMGHARRPAARSERLLRLLQEKGLAGFEKLGGLALG